MHTLRIAALDEVGCIAVTDKQGLQFLVADPSEQGRVIDLVAVEVQYRQHGAVGDRIDEFVAVPLVARGPVSDSPSPTITRVIRFGRS
jgi:hypothetical protein